MEIEVHCYNCLKTWYTDVAVENTSLTIIGWDFCGVCRKKLVREFEGQFSQKLLLPSLKPRIRVEEEDGA